MAVRPIDGDELLGIERLLDTDVVRQSKTASWLLDQVLHDIQAMPTLTLPNEPMTLEQLREMDSIPIWVVDTTINRREWCYWKGGLAYSCEAHPEYYEPDEYGLWLAYRRPKEEQ